MSVAEERRQQFNDTFNALLGDKIGKSRANYTDASMKKAIKDLAPKSSFKPKKEPSVKKVKAETPTVDVRDLIDKNKGKSKSTLESIWDVVSSPKEILSSVGSGLQKSIDIISRPGYAVANSVNEMAKAADSGEPFWSLGDDALYGAGRGLTGKDKTTWGEVVQNQINRDQESGGIAGAIQRKNPNIDFKASGTLDNPNSARAKAVTGGHLGDLDIPDWVPFLPNKIPVAYPGVQDLAGVTGDVLADPVNVVSLGSKSIATSTAKEIGEVAAKQTTKEILEESSIDVVKKIVSTEAKKAIPAEIKKVATKTVTGMNGPTKLVNSADDIVNDVLNKVDDLFHEVAGGPQKGKMSSTFKESTDTIARTTSEGYRSTKVKTVDPQVRWFQKNTGNFTQAQLEKRLNDNPLFKVWHDAYTDAVLVGEKDATKAAEKAYMAVGRSLDAQTAEIFSKVQLGLKDSMMRVPTLRIAGQDVMYSRRAGLMMQRLGNAVEGTALDNARKALSYSSAFPGFMTHLGQKARSLGGYRFNEVRKELIKVARETTQEDRKLLQKALDGGYALSGDMEDIRQILKQSYDDMFNREMSAGLRKADDYVDGYSYAFVKGKQSEVKDFAEARKKFAKENKHLTGYRGDDARVLGLKPEEDAFTNLLMRQVKHNRKMTRAYFGNDLATHYGIKSSSLDRASALAKNMQEATNMLDAAGKTALKDGEKLYITSDIKKVFDDYVKLSTVGSEESKQLLKVIDMVTGTFKRGNTVYWPGFHVRNFVSDAWMGALDGVKMSDYKDVFKGWRHKADATLRLGEEEVPFNRMLETYESEMASGGFASTEVHRATKRELVGQGVTEHLLHPTSLPGAVRRFSEHREDFGRFAHFYHAMQEEYPAALKRFKGDAEKAYESAAINAGFRVNKYKFDYGALTKTEQAVIRRAMPFYTYMRKAIPTLVESLALSPRNLVMTNKLFKHMVPGGENRWDAPTMPSYMQDLGFMNLNDGGGEPWGITGGILPTDSFNNAFENPAANLNPMLKALFEIQSGKDTFTGKPVDNWLELVGNNMRAKSTWDKVSADPTKAGTAEKLAFILGVPLTHVTKDKQDKQIDRERKDVNSRVKSLDDEVKNAGYHVYLTAKNQIRLVKVDKNGKAVATPKDFASLEEVKAALGL